MKPAPPVADIEQGEACIAGDRVVPFGVCIVNASLPPSYGGAELAALRYARRLAERGARVRFLGAVEESAAVDPDLPDWVYPIEVPGQEQRPGMRIPGATAIRLARRLWPRMFAMRRDFDVVHVFNSAPLFNLLAVPLARALGKPVVLESSLVGSDDAFTLRTGRPGRPTRKLPVRYVLYRLGSAFVAKSSALRDAYLRAKLDESRLYRIPYAVDTHIYRPANNLESKQARRELGLIEDGLLVLFVGGLNRRKGLHWLLEAFAQVVRLHPGAHLTVLGPGYKYEPGYVAELKASAEAEPLGGKVEFVDRLTDKVYEYMRAADIFVLPSEREGLPISVLEAMASGLAVVASEIPEIADSQIRDGIEGRLVPVGDVATLATVLEELLSRPEERQRLGQAARKRAVEEFSTEVVDPQYSKLYGELLK